VTVRTAFLPAGTYTIAFTCQGKSDLPEEPSELVFNPELPENRVIAVDAGSEQEVNFPEI
jgi:hypothetical protein